MKRLVFYIGILLFVTSDSKSQNSIKTWNVDSVKSTYYFKKKDKDSIGIHLGKPTFPTLLIIALKNMPPHVVKNYFFDASCEYARYEFNFYKSSQSTYVDYTCNWITLTIIKATKDVFEFTITYNYPEKREGGKGEYKAIDYYKCTLPE